jgi:hypothetical protein
VLSKKSLKILKVIQNPLIEERETTQWPKEKVQKDKQRSTYTPTDKGKLLVT